MPRISMAADCLLRMAKIVVFCDNSLMQLFLLTKSICRNICKFVWRLIRDGWLSMFVLSVDNHVSGVCK